MVEVSHWSLFAKKGRVIWKVKPPDWKTASVFCLPRKGGQGPGGVIPSGRRCRSSRGIKAAGGDIRAGHRRTGGATGLLEAIGLITKNFKRNSTFPLSLGLPENKQTKLPKNPKRQKRERRHGHGALHRGRIRRAAPRPRLLRSSVRMLTPSARASRPRPHRTATSQR